MVVPNHANGCGVCPLRMLGLKATATAAEVMREWRQRMLKAHPDKSSAADATERTQQLVALKERALRAVEARAQRATAGGYASSRDDVQVGFVCFLYVCLQTLTTRKNAEAEQRGALG